MLKVDKGLDRTGVFLVVEKSRSTEGSPTSDFRFCLLFHTGSSVTVEVFVKASKLVNALLLFVGRRQPMFLNGPDRVGIFLTDRVEKRPAALEPRHVVRADCDGFSDFDVTK